MTERTHAECGRMGGLATRGILSVKCPITGRQCFTAAYTEIGAKGRANQGHITREQRQEWGRKGRAIAGRGRPKQVNPQ